MRRARSLCYWVSIAPGVPSPGYRRSPPRSPGRRGVRGGTGGAGRGASRGRGLRAAELVHGRARQGRQLLLALADIDAGNVKRLGFAWSYDWATRSAARKRRRSWSTASCTPPAPGVMSTRWMPRRGKELWRYDPKRDWFPAQKSLLRSGQSRGRRLEGQGVRGFGGWPAARARRGDGQEDLGGRHHRRSQAALLEHRRSADRGRRGGHRQWRRGHGARRRARLRLSLRPVETAHSNGASTPCRRGPGSPTRIRSWRRRTRPGIRTAIRNTKAAERRGTASPTTPT